MGSAEAWEVPLTVTDPELNDFVWERAREHAEMYGVHPPEYDDDGEELENEEGLYGFNWDNVEGYWEPYDSDKHDSKLLYGYNNTVQFNKY